LTSSQPAAAFSRHSRGSFTYRRTKPVAAFRGAPENQPRPTFFLLHIYHYGDKFSVLKIFCYSNLPVTTPPMRTKMCVERWVGP